MYKSSGLGYQPDPNPELPSGRGLSVGSNERDRCAFLHSQIKMFLALRSRREKSWREAANAYNCRTWRDERTRDLNTSPVDVVMAGIPYAVGQTNVAALGARNPEFKVKTRRAGARDFAKLCRAILKNAWSRNELQYTTQRLILQLHNTAIGILKIHYETDFNEWAKQEKRREKQAVRRAGMPSFERTLEEHIDMMVEQEVADAKPPSSQELGFEPDHACRRDEVGIKNIPTCDYIADPDSESLAYGPRWEGRILRLRLNEVRRNPRYRKSVTSKLKPTRTSKSSFFDNRFVRGNSPSVPEEFQIVELYELVLYDDEEFRSVGGALITLAPDCDEELERRANPYGTRCFVVDDCSADGSMGGEDALFPPTSFDAWKDVWRSLAESLYRMVRQLKKAPNTKLLIAAGAETGLDDLEGFIESDEGDVCILPTQHDDIRKVVQELAARQVSGEYVNAIRFYLELIRIIEGLGPNQLGGAALKSETSAAEATEIGTFARARLDVKQNAINRILTRAAALFLHTVFRFKSFTEITDMVGAELLQGVDLDQAEAAAKNLTVNDLVIEIEAGSMTPDGPQQKMAKIAAILEICKADPLLDIQKNREALTDLLNDWGGLDTGEDMFLGLDDPRSQLNRVLMTMMQAQAQGGAGGGQPGEASPPKTNPVSEALA